MARGRCVMKVRKWQAAGEMSAASRRTHLPIRWSRWPLELNCAAAMLERGVRLWARAVRPVRNGVGEERQPLSRRESDGQIVETELGDQQDDDRADAQVRAVGDVVRF